MLLGFDTYPPTKKIQQLYYLRLMFLIQMAPEVLCE